MIKFRDLTRWQRNEIIATFKRARKVLSIPELDIRLAPAVLTYGRILIIIPKKVGSAPQRNLLRRRIKMLYYENEWYTKKFDWIIFLKPKAVECSFIQLQAFLSQALPVSSSKL